MVDGTGRELQENGDLAANSTFRVSVQRSVCSFTLDATRPVRFLTKSF